MLARSVPVSPRVLNQPTTFIDELRAGGVLLDGGMGSSLMGEGGLQPEKVTGAALSHPELVAQVHGGFLNAGSCCIQTNSFGANRLALEACGERASVEALNRAAVALARSAADAYDGVWVAGNIGPASLWGDGYSTLNDGDLADAYAEQGSALLAGGVDLFSLETFGSSSEARLAMDALRRLSSRPILVSLTFVGIDTGFATLDGEPVLEALLGLQDAGADAVGINCGVGSAGALACAMGILGRLSVPFCIKPNVGSALEGSGVISYTQPPEQFAHHMLQALQLGASAVGGCCGADARFIEVLGRSL